MDTVINVLGIIWAVIMLSLVAVAPFIGKFSGQKTDKNTADSPAE